MTSDSFLDRSRLPSEHIDRESYEPAYLQLANILRQQIAGGLYRPGDQLPSEAQLCRRYSISPMTVRRSINLLADQGVVSTAQGRGTFVRSLELDKAIFDLNALHDLFDLGHEGSVRLLDVRVVSADERTAARLHLQVGEPAIYIRRLFTRHSQPVFYHRAYLVYDPTRPIVEAELDATSLHGLFTSSRSDLLKCGKLSIEATLMNEEEAALLERPFPAAAFSLGHIFYDYSNRPLSWGWFLIPGDSLQFTTRVGLDG
jgi:DNA-binding GntR family transcriptional regulator